MTALPRLVGLFVVAKLDTAFRYAIKDGHQIGNIGGLLILDQLAGAAILDDRGFILFLSNIDIAETAYRNRDIAGVGVSLF